MPETTTIVRDAADIPGAAVSDLAGSVGALTNEAAHHAESLADHATQLVGVNVKNALYGTTQVSGNHNIYGYGTIYQQLIPK
jgi:hypothetical protein